MQQPKEFYLKLQDPILATIYAAVKELPWKIAQPVLAELDEQVVPQLQPAPAPEPETQVNQE